jgi:hypothetical protein
LRGWGGRGRGWGKGGRNDPNIVCTYEKIKIFLKKDAARVEESMIPSVPVLKVEMTTSLLPVANELLLRWLLVTLS